ncbi:MAG: lipoyl(octanoyl) transferase LipB [Terriglobales bacterium]
MISVLQLGTLDYATGLGLQQKLVHLRKENRVGDVLLLLEHAPVITLGRNAKTANIIASPEQLAERGVEVFESDRGGDVTFHGPGQLVGYPIFDLRGLPSSDGKSKSLGVIEYVRKLEEVLMRTCAEFDIAAKRICGLTGVWTVEPPAVPSHGATGVPARPRPAALSQSEAKIAAIGVHISRSVTSHGFALNVDTDLSYFDLIIPCGLVAKPVTSMAKELGKPLDLEKVTNSVVRNFGNVFQQQTLWVETLEALLGETIGVPVKLPGELRKIHNLEDTFWA